MCETLLMALNSGLRCNMETKISTKKERSILIVEDEIESLQLLSAVLVAKYPDISIYSAMNGEKGLELFNLYFPDLVITDINMPNINGIQL